LWQPGEQLALLRAVGLALLIGLRLARPSREL
jgi:hypothetical protein